MHKLKRKVYLLRHAGLEYWKWVLGLDVPGIIVGFVITFLLHRFAPSPVYIAGIILTLAWMWFVSYRFPLSQRR